MEASGKWLASGVMSPYQDGSNRKRLCLELTKKPHRGHPWCSSGWLNLCTSSAGGTGLILVRELRSLLHGQKKKKNPSDFILDSEPVTEKRRHSAAFSLLNPNLVALK